MENIKNTYKNLTNVDIDEQRRIWDERGKGYYGEFLLFSKLYKNINGNCKILMNLEIPVDAVHKTEIDLLLIHETGIYIFEAKHYKGRIYGKDSDNIWTQYFRTTQNKTFRNPFIQNGYHMRAVLSLFPDAPIYSIVVFTNEEVEINVDNENPNIDVCKLDDIGDILRKNFKNNPQKYSMEDINEIFKKLSQYSPMKRTVVCDGTERPFEDWLLPLIEVSKENNCITEKRAEELEQQKKFFKFLSIGSIIVFAILTILMVAILSTGYNEKIELYKQKYLTIEEINKENYNKLNSIIDVSEENFIVLSDGVHFSAKLNLIDTNYKVQINENSKYIVHTKSGELHEYNMFQKLYYFPETNTLNIDKTSGILRQIVFKDIHEISDIEYIKITDILLYENDSDFFTTETLELELYS